MAPNSTLYVIALTLADADRGVYEALELRIPRHPSETAEFLLMRVMAYALEYGEGIALTAGIAAVDEPAVLMRDLTGRLLSWIEVGAPDAERLHRGARAAERCVVYTHRDPQWLLAQYRNQRIHRADQIPLRALDSGFVRRVAERLQRRSTLSVTVSDAQLYVELDGYSDSCEIQQSFVA